VNIERRTGDLFHQLDLPAWGHGVNCAGAMGRGIAVSFKAMFPAMFVEYRARCRRRELAPGDVFAWETTDHPCIRVVYNLATQPDWRGSATLENIGASVERMALLAAQAGIDRVGVPRIGAGLGGLTWEAVEATLKAAHGPGVTLVVVSPS